MATLPVGTYPVTEYCNLIVQSSRWNLEVSRPEMPSEEEIRTELRKRYQRAVTIGPWRRTAANGWTALITSAITSR